MGDRYKLIDGKLYRELDTTDIQNRLQQVLAEVKPYKDGIQQCEAQIAEYEAQISTIIANSGIDKEIIRVIDPEKADFLGI